MTPQQYLADKTHLNPVQPNHLDALRSEYITMSRKNHAGEIACYTAGVIVFALISYIADKPSSIVLAAFGAIVIALCFLGAQRSAIQSFDRAARQLTMKELPEKLLAMYLDRPQVESTLNHLLRSQNQCVYRFQVNELYELERNDRIQAIQAQL